LTSYIGGAFSFAQESLKRFFEDHGETPLAEGGGKKGVCFPPFISPFASTNVRFVKTLIFTGTLGAIRCSANYAAYGATRSSVRQLSQSLAREFSEKGVHVVHTIANGGIEDADGEAQKQGKKMSAEAVGRTYLWLSQQGVDLFTHELDLRPAAEKF